MRNGARDKSIAVAPEPGEAKHPGPISRCSPLFARFGLETDPGSPAASGVTAANR